MHIWNSELGCYEDLKFENLCAVYDYEATGIYKSDGEFGIKYLADNSYALLYIPSGATVHINGLYCDEPTTDRRKFHGFDQKRRASIALVLSIVRLDIACNSTGDETIVLNNVNAGKSWYDNAFSYKSMDIVRPSHPFDCRDEECSTGIHYYPRFYNGECDLILTFIQHWADKLIGKDYTKEKCEKMFKEKPQHEG